MTTQLQNGDQTETRPESADPGESMLTARTRRGMVWTATGLVILAALALFAVEALSVPGGRALPRWLWPTALVMGVAFTGVGFGVMVDEAARINREITEADHAFGEQDDEYDTNPDAGENDLPRE